MSRFYRGARPNTTSAADLPNRSDALPTALRAVWSAAARRRFRARSLLRANAAEASFGGLRQEQGEAVLPGLPPPQKGDSHGMILMPWVRHAWEMPTAQRRCRGYQLKLCAVQRVEDRPRAAARRPECKDLKQRAADLQNRSDALPCSPISCAKRPQRRRA